MIGQAREMSLAENISRVQARVDAAARRSGRCVDDVTLVAVSKTVPATVVAEAAKLGLRSFGENRVAEAAAKVPEVAAQLGETAGIQWHLIGHLQTNKVRQCLPLFETIESVDSLRLARHIDAEAVRLGRRVRVLLEVNVAGEATKQGLLTEELMAAAREIVKLPQLDVVGVMTVAPLADDSEAVRPVFRELRGWQERLRAAVPGSDWRHLSMGMSNDFEVAIEEGATMVRLGKAIFGERQQPRDSG